MQTLILGGARSGKSRHAEQLARASKLKVIYIATAEALDEDMQARIIQHQNERPAHWQTVETPRALAATLRAHDAADTCLLVDCLTLWLSNLLLHPDPCLLERERTALLHSLPDLQARLILVANEVGLGIVPDNPLARRFRDEAGRLHQSIAAQVEQVLFLAAGLPLTLKDTQP